MRVYRNLLVQSQQKSKEDDEKIKLLQQQTVVLEEKIKLQDQSAKKMQITNIRLKNWEKRWLRSAANYSDTNAFLETLEHDIGDDDHDVSDISTSDEPVRHVNGAASSRSSENGHSKPGRPPKKTTGAGINTKSPWA
jgi:hypothetical protein